MPVIYGGGGSSGLFSTDVVTTTKFLGGDGSASAPTYGWTSEGSGTGFYRSGASTIRFSIAGTDTISYQGSATTLTAAMALLWGSSGVSSPDTAIARAGANSLIFGISGATTTTTSRTEINKAVTAFTNATLKSVFTVTVPNAAHHATILFTVDGALGAGGAIGAGEAMATNTYMIAIVRTAGVATVATATAATNAVAVAVAGAATVTATAAVSAISGIVSATQTFTIDVTISRSGGSSDNHTAQCYARLLNANASGITIL